MVKLNMLWREEEKGDVRHKKTCAIECEMRVNVNDTESAINKGCNVRLSTGTLKMDLARFLARQLIDIREIEFISVCQLYSEIEIY